MDDVGRISDTRPRTGLRGEKKDFKFSFLLKESDSSDDMNSEWLGYNWMKYAKVFVGYL